MEAHPFKRVQVQDQGPFLPFAPNGAFLPVFPKSIDFVSHHKVLVYDYRTRIIRCRIIGYLNPRPFVSPGWLVSFSQNSESAIYEVCLLSRFAVGHDSLVVHILLVGP